MVENEVVEVEPKARKRKPNFSVSEIAIITEYVGKNLHIMQSKLTNNITNKAKKEMWEEITREVNAVGQASRSVQEVKDKWKNLHSDAKKEFNTFRRESKKTGGGPPPKPPSQSSEKLIELLEGTPAFSGLEGFEAGGDDGGAGEYRIVLLMKVM